MIADKQGLDQTTNHIHGWEQGFGSVTFQPADPDFLDIDPPEN